MLPNPSAPLRDWRITLVRAKRQNLSLIEAPDQTTAIAETIKLFNFLETQRSRLIAQPVE